MGRTTERAAKPMPRVERRCPVCGEGLVASTAGAACGTCGRLYADSTSGIADLRLAFPDPELSRDDDARLGAALDELSAERDLAALIDEHWRLVGKRPELAARFTAQEVSARSRSEPIVDAIAAARGAAIGPDDTALEVGCGTAALASAIARRGASVVATDLSLRWLVLARTRLAEESAHRVELVACAAEALPFPDESFSVVAASDVVEHVEDPDRFVAECSRVLRPGGLLFLATPNRFSLGLEPHVRLWGVGFLPRRAAEAYVRTCRHTSYAHVRLLSARSLARLLSDHGFESEIVTPAVAESSVPMYSGMEQTLVRAYNHVRTRSAARPVLRAVGPFFHVFGRKADRR